MRTVVPVADDITGTHELGPGAGRLLVKTGREGLAARAGHDLTLEITRWSARVTVPAGGDLAAATVTAELDLGSLTVRTGSGGAKPLSDKDRRDIQAQARKILGDPARAAFTSTSVIPAPGPAPNGAIEGTLTLHGTTRPLRLQLTGSANAQFSGAQFSGAATIRQTDFGITPYSGFFGTLKLKDEITVEFKINIRPIPNESV
jgi:polyisoprenoid-binding protein YceI